MPLVEVTMIEGRTPQQIRALLDALTAAVETSISAPRESIQVLIREVPATHWATRGVTVAERRAAQAAQDRAG